MTRDEHMAVVAHNEAFYGTIPADNSDWAITVLFYAAAHLIEAYLAVIGQHSASHKDRTRMIEGAVQLNLVKDHYHHLSKLCWNARYQGTRPSPQQLLAAYNAKYLPLKARIQELLVAPHGA